jgi:hypothetical protein
MLLKLGSLINEQHWNAFIHAKDCSLSTDRMNEILGFRMHTVQRWKL